MIQFMVQIVKIVVAACIALLFNSCGDVSFGKSITGSGNVVSKERNVTEFTKVEVSNGLECEITQGDKINVTVVADDNLQEGIETKVENGTLKISSIYNSFRNVTSKKVKVQLPTVSGLQTSSGSSLTTINILKSTNIALKSSSGSELQATIEADKATLETSSGSSMIVSGKALEAATVSSSGSTIEAENLLANDITSKSSSGSSSIVSPIVSLKAHASSGSSIEYAKTPKNLAIEESSGGDVSKN